jgi:hypothetical protein
MTKKLSPLQIIGLIMIILGALILFSAFPLQSMSVVSIGPAKVTDVPKISATRILIGVISIILGLVIYFSKEGLKMFIKK